MSGIRIVLADDHALVVAGISALLKEIDGASIVAVAGDGMEAVKLCKQYQPDLVIMDVSMKELNGIDAAAQIRAEVPATRVLILSGHTGEDYVRRAIRAGVSGYLVKDSAPSDLKLAIEAIMRGEVYLSPRVSQHIVSGFLDEHVRKGENPLDVLTARQREILQMIAEGKSTKEIAFQMDVSPKTVETHRAGLMDRLGIHDIAGLALFAARTGLISLDREPD
ncbi:MAG: response regulator transcription factor [Betaproteobacteria bacterium]|nr:response regulator transcription factor [Betaproteobacteria bacterium]